MTLQDWAVFASATGLLQVKYIWKADIKSYLLMYWLEREREVVHAKVCLLLFNLLLLAYAPGSTIFSGFVRFIQFRYQVQICFDSVSPFLWF